MQAEGGAAVVGLAEEETQVAPPPPEPPAPPRRPGRVRRALGIALTAGSVLVVWGALVFPQERALVRPAAVAQIPIEGIAIVAVASLLPALPRRLLAVLLGLLAGILVAVDVLDMGFRTAFDRPFNPIDDWAYAGIGLETLRDSVGRGEADLIAIGVVVLVALLLAVPTLAMLRVAEVAARHRHEALIVAGALGGIWAVAWAVGGHLAPGMPLASARAVGTARDEVQEARTAFHEHVVFARELRVDRYRDTPGDRLLTGLRGKDVLLVFVESYGRNAVQGTSYSRPIDRLLDAGTARLAGAGFGARSGWLTSSTFGGASWLAHGAMQSGTWVSTQSRYDQLVTGDRFTLTGAFKRAGWRVVAEAPANARRWAEGSTFYHYDHVYDRRDIGYRGPSFAYAPMPDQFVLEALQRHELGRTGRPPVFAEIDLVSSHEPWTRIPTMVDWDALGDGSVFSTIPMQTISQAQLFRDRRATRAAYGRSIEYSLTALISFVQRYGDPNLVLVVLGDHQPMKYVSGEHASHDVPISIIARDPQVLARLASWGWDEGLRPSPKAPVWPMSAFRDRFLDAYGPTPPS